MDKDKLVLEVKLAEHVGRYGDMLTAIKIVVGIWKQLNYEEQRLFYEAFRRAVEARRNSYLILSGVMQKNENNEMKQMAEEYRAKVKQELREMCNDFFELINNVLLPRANDAESTVFYHNMKGDFYNYLLCVATGNDKNIVEEEALHAYTDGYNFSKCTLTPTNPYRLGIAARLAIFYACVLNSSGRACQIAKQALDDATSELGTLDGDSFMKCMSKMETLSDILKRPHVE